MKQICKIFLTFVVFVLILVTIHQSCCTVTGVTVVAITYLLYEPSTADLVQTLKEKLKRLQILLN